MSARAAASTATLTLAASAPGTRPGPAGRGPRRGHSLIVSRMLR